MTLRNKTGFALAAIALLVLSACSSGSETAVEESPAAEETTEATQEVNPCSKDQLETLTAGTLTIATGEPGVRGSYYGSFYDTLDQPRSGDTPIDIPIAMLLNSTSSASGISIVDSSKITIANTGFYNIQFSVQIVDTGTNPAVVHIWLRKNGTDIAWTNTGFEVEKKGGKLVAAWNFIEGANAGDYFQLMWSTDERSVKLEAFPVSTSPAYPAIPSLILTVEQVS